MKTIRRIYFYAVAFIGIEVVVWGTVGLLRSIFQTQDIVRSSSELAQALALILVGLPIFLIHWLIAQNAAEKDAEERSSTVRALFLYGILFATGIVAAQQLLALVNRTLLQAATSSGGLAVVGGTQSWADNLIAFLVNLAAAAYFYSILRANQRELADAERGRFNEVRRLYRIVWVSYGLILTIFGAQQALTYIFNLPSSILGSIGRETALNAIALLIIGTPIWVYAWLSLQSALSQEDEQTSFLRLGFLYLLSMLGLIVTMVSAGELLYQALLRLLGEPVRWSDGLKDIGGPLSIGVPMAVLWTYYRGWLAVQISFDADPAGRAGKWRLSIYLRSLLGLSALIAGTVALFSVLVPMALGISFLGSQGLREPLAGSLAAMAIGLLVWLPAWREAQRGAARDDHSGENARRSLVRKVYLYLVIFGSVIGVMVSAGFMIYSLVSAGLGSPVNDLLKTVLQSIADLIVFALLLYYHLTILRGDGAVHTDTLLDRQAGFRVLVLDSGGNFGPSMQELFTRRGLNFRVEIANVDQSVPETLPDMVILPSALALRLPETARKWLQAYSGCLIYVGESTTHEIWTTDAGRAAEAARAIFEGRPQDASRSQNKPSVWTYVAYVFAVLFGIQLLFMLIMMGISMVFSG